MGALTDSKDKIDIQTDHTERPSSSRLRKFSRVSVRGTPNLQDVIMGVKIGSIQRIAELTFNNVDITQYSDDGISTDFGRIFSSSTSGTEQWVGFVIERNNLPHLGNFETRFAVEPFTLTPPDFQLVPFILAYSLPELRRGHYFIGVSVLTDQAKDRPTGSE